MNTPLLKPLHPSSAATDLCSSAARTMAHRVHSVGKVPFSWENAPGICKTSCREYPEIIDGETLKLPPPPCPLESPRISVHHDIHIPLPPCPFQPPLRSSSRKGLKREDPFLAAYMECTKKSEQGKSSRGSQKSGAVRGRINLWSCKHSCGVKEDNLVKVVHGRSKEMNSATNNEGEDKVRSNCFLPI